jgi:rhodanese-related sulfurtransferase
MARSKRLILPLAVIALLATPCVLWRGAAGLSAGTEITRSNIFQTTLEEPNQKTAEVSTEELRKTLDEKSATVLDARPMEEFGVSHIPGAVNVSAKPGVPISTYVSDVAEIGRLVKNNKSASLVLYCNGPFCGKSKRLSEELLAAGYTDVRRYQLGMPVWRALVGVSQIEPVGLRTVYMQDKTAVWIDVRDSKEFAAGSVPGSKNLPRSGVLPGKDVGEVKKAKDDGRLPMNDHNTRIIVFGRDVEQSRAVAEALAREAFDNVAFYAGSFEALRSELTTRDQ